MESLKYCLVLATVIGYVVAKNPTLPLKEATRDSKVKGTVSIVDDCTLKIQNYAFPGE